MGEETLAGGLSNTIAGRICNHFDFKGGGYTVDGACASSLLAVAHACSALAAGDLDLCAGGWSRPEHRSIRAGRFRQSRRPGSRLDAGLSMPVRTASGRAKVAESSC